MDSSACCRTLLDNNYAICKKRLDIFYASLPLSSYGPWPVVLSQQVPGHSRDLVFIKQQNLMQK